MENLSFENCLVARVKIKQISKLLNLYFVDASSFAFFSRFYWHCSGVFIVNFE